MSDDVRRSGRPRDRAADDLIAEAALSILREQGPGAVSVAAIATRSGVARTTIYRRYRDREEILAAAMRSVAVRPVPSDDVGVGEKLLWIVEQAEDVLERGIGLGGVAAALTGQDPDMTSALRRALAAGLAPVREQVLADVASGALAPGVDADALIDVVLGAYLAHALRRSTPVDVWRARTVSLLEALVIE